MSTGVGLLIFGLLAAISPALTEIGMGMSAAGVFFCLGALAGRKGVNALSLVWGSDADHGSLFKPLKTQGRSLGKHLPFHVPLWSKGFLKLLSTML